MHETRELRPAVVACAQALGWRVWWTHDSRHSPKGWPDLVLCNGERVLFRELKAGRGKLTNAQADCLDLLRVSGLDAAVWHERDWLSGAIEAELRCS